MIARRLSERLLAYASQYPIVTVTGPRQSGKTTLVRSVFSGKPYVSLEDVDNRIFAREDPRGFLNRFSEGAIIDEIQHVPDLCSYLQTEVDARPSPGRFILTGSQQFEVMRSISQSLAGRTALARLLPLSCDELFAGRPAPPLEQVLHAGFYPRIHAQGLSPREALSFYVSTYLERDVRGLLNVADLSLFERFLKLCAGRSGQLLNMQNLGAEVGVTHNTIRSWLGVLEAGYIVKRLAPWHANLGKRLVKTPKLYFIDVGLAAHLLGIEEARQLQTHPLRGALFENLVVAEALKQRCHSGRSDNLFFYRDHAGHEVDLVLEHAGGLDGIEIKCSETLVPEFFEGLGYFARQVPGVRSTTLVHAGDADCVHHGHRAIPWVRFSVDCGDAGTGRDRANVER